MRFVSTRIKKWSDIQKFAKKDWIFRGERTPRALATNFERLCLRDRISISKRGDLERRIIREFKRTYHHYSPHVPESASVDTQNRPLMDS